MQLSKRASLWPSREDCFFKDSKLNSKKLGEISVFKLLATLTDAKQEFFKERMNKYYPIDLFNAFMWLGFRVVPCLTYNPSLKFYIDELIKLNDLFVIIYFTNKSVGKGLIRNGRVTVLFRDRLYLADGSRSIQMKECPDKQLIGIYRIVPEHHCISF